MSILSIQSHVAYGKVGNRAATFTLERMGHDVIAIHTVQFSNHTGYGTFEGDILPATNIQKIFHGLDQLTLSNPLQAILSGYLGSVEIAEVLLQEAQAIQKKNPKTIFLCDPVIGDTGRGVFINPKLATFIRDQLIPIADWITPNHFEFEFLVQEKVCRVAELKTLCQKHPLLKNKVVIVKSFLHDELQEGTIATYGWNSHTQEEILLEAPYIHFPTPPNGIGDLFAALFLGHALKTNLQNALQKAHAITHAILKATEKAQTRELQIIENQGFLEQ